MSDEEVVPVEDISRRAFYDSLYLALAVMADCRLVTADRKLFDAVKDTAPIRKHILWVADVPAKG